VSFIVSHVRKSLHVCNKELEEIIVISKIVKVAEALNF